MSAGAWHWLRVEAHGCLAGPAPSLQDLSQVDNDFSDIDANIDAKFAGTGAASQPRAVPAAWSWLVALDLSRTRCRAACLSYLRDAGLFTTLQRFQLEGFFGPAEARILVAGKLDQLTTLQLLGMADLSEAESDVLGDAGLELLIASPMFPDVLRRGVAGAPALAWAECGPAGYAGLGAGMLFDGADR